MCCATSRRRKRVVRSYEIKRALVFNSKTPLGISMNFLSHMRRNDLRTRFKEPGRPPTTASRCP